MHSFRITTSEQQDIVTLALSGRMELPEAARLETALDALLHQKKLRVILDFSALRTASSLGLAGVQLYVESFRARGGKLKLVGLSPSVKSVIQVLGLDKRAEIHRDADTAIKTFLEARAPNRATTNSISK
jgi:anti-sigma B factor antagonist